MELLYSQSLVKTKLQPRALAINYEKASRKFEGFILTTVFPFNYYFVVKTQSCFVKTREPKRKLNLKFVSLHKFVILWEGKREPE